MKRFPKRYANHPLLGKGKARSQKWWMVFGKLLMEHQYIEKTSSNEFILVAPSSMKASLPLSSDVAAGKGRLFLAQHHASPTLSLELVLSQELLLEEKSALPQLKPVRRQPVPLAPVVSPEQESVDPKQLESRIFEELLAWVDKQPSELQPTLPSKATLQLLAQFRFVLLRCSESYMIHHYV